MASIVHIVFKSSCNGLLYIASLKPPPLRTVEKYFTKEVIKIKQITYLPRRNFLVNEKKNAKKE
jgi:hypothetical protein